MTGSDNLRVAIKELIKEVITESFSDNDDDRDDRRGGIGNRGRVRDPEHDRRLKENRGD